MGATVCRLVGRAVGRQRPRRCSRAHDPTGPAANHPTNAATNATTRGLGQKGWWGWYDDAEMEDTVAKWLSAGSEDEAQMLFDKAHARALDQVPTIPLGQSFRDGAVRSDLTGMLNASVDLFWNVDRA